MAGLDRWYDYVIFGIAPEKPEGHEFSSQVPDLELHPELWVRECPFSIPRRNLDIRVERRD